MEIKSRIGEIVSFYFKILRTPYAKMLGKGVVGKELVALLAETHTVEPNDLIPIENLGIHKKDGSLDIPITFEQWLQNEKQKELDIYMGTCNLGV